MDYMKVENILKSRELIVKRKGVNKDISRSVVEWIVRLLLKRLIRVRLPDGSNQGSAPT